MYDVVIIGAGPAGMAAALYASRANLKTVIFERDLPGGQLNNTETIDNYLGVPLVSALTLAESMYEQALSFGAEEKFGNVKEIIKAPEGHFEIHTNKQSFLSKAVVVATGTEYKKLNVPGEMEFEAKGVSYCAICDGPFFKNKRVMVVGGGDSALEEADYLTQFAEVLLIHRRNDYRAKEHLQERVKNNPKITRLMNAEVSIIKGTRTMEKARIKLNSNNAVTNIDMDGCFIYVGQTPQTDLLASYGVLDEEGYVLAAPDGMTSTQGLFAVGDILQKKIRQVANAVGEGSVAGQSVYEYLQNIK